MKVFESHTELKEVEVITKRYTVCDKCYDKVVLPNFSAFEFKLEITTGSQYPETGFGETTTLDLCPKCSKKFSELLKSNGYKLQTKNWDN